MRHVVIKIVSSNISPGGDIFLFFFFSFFMAFSNRCNLRRVGIQELIEIFVIVLRIIQPDAIHRDLTIEHGRGHRVIERYIRIIGRP